MLNAIDIDTPKKCSFIKTLNSRFFLIQNSSKYFVVIEQNLYKNFIILKLMCNFSDFLKY